MNTINSTQMIQHAEIANAILNSIHELTVCGHVDFRDNGSWPYDWALLQALIARIPQMKVVSKCELQTAFNGCWLRKELQLNVALFGHDINGTLSVTRSGPALERVTWHWTPAIDLD